MTLSDYMAWQKLKDQDVADLITKSGVPIHRTAIVRLRVGSRWIGSPHLAWAISKVTKGHVTAHDFAYPPPKGQGNGTTQKAG